MRAALVVPSSPPPRLPRHAPIASASPRSKTTSRPLAEGSTLPVLMPPARTMLTSRMFSKSTIVAKPPRPRMLALRFTSLTSITSQSRCTVRQADSAARAQLVARLVALASGTTKRGVNRPRLRRFHRCARRASGHRPALHQSRQKTIHPAGITFPVGHKLSHKMSTAHTKVTLRALTPPTGLDYKAFQLCEDDPVEGQAA